MLISKALSSLSGSSDAARSTRVLVFNRSRFPLYSVGTSFETGDFTPGQKPPGVIEAERVGGDRAEAHRCGTGVTNGVVR